MLTNSSSDRFIKTYLEVDGPSLAIRKVKLGTCTVFYIVLRALKLPPRNDTTSPQLRDFYSAVGMKMRRISLVAAQGPSHVAVRIYLENGGTYCESI